MAALTTYHEPILQAVKDPAVQTFLVMGILGLLAKDFNVTGGTAGQPSSPQALMDANQHPSVANPPVGPMAYIVTDKPYIPTPGTSNVPAVAQEPTPEAKKNG